MNDESDVTVHRSQVDAAGNGEILLNGILDSVSAHLAVIDRHGTIVMVNEAWRRFARENAEHPQRMTAHTGEGTNYLTVCDASSGDSAEGAAEAAAGIRAVLQRVLPSFTLEYPCHAPGQPRWFVMSVTPLAAGGGAVVSHTDITARKLAEDALRDSELRLTLALEASGDGLWDWNLETGLAYLSPGYYALTGHRPEDAAPDVAFLRSIVHPDDWDGAWGALEDHLRGVKPAVDQEYRIRTASGSIRWLRGRGRIVSRNERGEATRMVGLISDVTERKKIQQALEENEARYRAVVEEQTELIIRLLPDGTLVFVNEMFCRLFGKTAAELIGSRWQPTAHPDEVPLLQAGLQRLSPDNPVTTIEELVRVAGGERRWMQFVVRAFFDPVGDIREILSVGRDITERRLAEARLRDLLEENTRLGRELIAVQEKERATLARELHDELSQDLAAIRAYAAAISRAAVAGPGDARANAQAIQDCASRIYTSSHRLMEGLRPQVLDSAGLTGALAALVSDWSASHPEIRATLRCPVHDAALDEETRIQLFRIAQECLTNVAKHASARRVRIFLGWRHGNGGDSLRLVVQDDGVGMSCTNGPRGHGLIVMRERAHSLGGSFDCRHVRGLGVRVAVEVPVRT